MQDGSLGEPLGSLRGLLDGPIMRPPKYVSVEKGVATFLDETGREVGSMSESTYRAVVEKFEKQLIKEEKPT